MEATKKPAANNAIPEVIFNLWYAYDPTGTIFFLLGRSYVGQQSENESLALLRRFAQSDHRIAQYFPLPSRFHTTIVENGTTRILPVIHASSLSSLGGPEMLFQEAILQLHAQVHALSGLSLTDNPVVCITPLLLSIDGTLTAQTSRERE